MTNRSGAIAMAALVAGLAIGGAAGYLAGSAATDDAHPPARTTQPVAPGPVQAPAEPAAAPHRATRPRTASSEPVDLSSLKLDAPETATGDGKITGVVLDEHGAPVPGVLVRATPQAKDDDDSSAPSGPPGSPPPRVDIDREVRALVRRLRHAEATLHEATTDASGAYALTGLVAEPHDVEAWLAGFRVERTGRRSWEPVPVGATCDFKATSIHHVTATVLLPDGTPPEAANVSWKTPGSGNESSSSWTTKSPEIEVPPGTYEFTATSGPNDIYRSPPQTVTVTAGASQTVTLRLAARPGIRVRVVYASSERPRDVRVAALKLDGAAAADPKRLLDASHAEWIEGGASECALTDLEPGTYLAGLTFRGGFVGATAPVTVGTDLTSVELRVTEADARDTVKLWVRGPDGEPVRDVHIVCGCRGADGMGYSAVNATADADGTFRIPHYEQSAPSLGNSSGSSNGGPGSAKRTYYIEAKSALYGADEAVYDPAADREVTIRLAAPARLRVTLGGYAQYEDRDRLGLELRPTGSTPRSHLDEDEITIDAAGVATLGPVRPGAFEVVLSLAKAADSNSHGRRHYAWNSTELSRTPVTLGAGENAVTVPVPSVCDLVVTVDASASVSRVRLEGAAADGSRSSSRSGNRTEGSNEITFAAVPPGRYRLVTSDGDMPLTMPDDRRVTFRPRPFNAYYLAVTDRGYLNELGLRTGDLVVAIDGTDLKDRLVMEAAIATAKTRESSKFTILRGGQRFDVTADGKRFEEDDGSTYAPCVR